MTPNEMRDWLKGALGREVVVEYTTFDGKKKYMVEYFNMGAPLSKLVGDSEEEAIERLFLYLSNAQSTEVDDQPSG